jgi:ABC-2 type transport system ATP-binding protein
LNELDAGNGAELVPVTPRFEDAFIEALGGGPGGDSVLAKHLRPVPGNDETVVEAKQLTKQFGSFTATDHVDFSVKRGEIFGLLGPNGAGKSTTFRMMCGLLTPTSGEARVMGIDLKTSASEARQRLGYMAQKFSLYGNLTVQQNLKFFAGAYGLRGARQKDAISEMVEVFKLQPSLDTTTDTLPLGFKQRLALACAIMHEPAILFLDEPTSGVDPVTRREFWTHINAVVEKGVTVMVTTHFMDEAEYCDRIALVFRGKIIAAGSPDQLKDQVANPQNPEPSMEDAFIALVEQHTAEFAA